MASTGNWIHPHGFVEATGIVGQIQQSAELIYRALLSRFIVIVLLAAVFKPKFERMLIPDPTERFRQSVRVLRQRSGSRAALGDADQIAISAEGGTTRTNVVVEQLDLGNTVICLPRGLRLVVVVARKVQPEFVQHGWADDPIPTDRSDIVVWQYAHIV